MLRNEHKQASPHDWFRVLEREKSLQHILSLPLLIFDRPISTSCNILMSLQKAKNPIDKQAKIRSNAQLHTLSSACYVRCALRCELPWSTSVRSLIHRSDRLLESTRCMHTLVQQDTIGVLLLHSATYTLQFVPIRKDILRLRNLSFEFAVNVSGMEMTLFIYTFSQALISY